MPGSVTSPFSVLQMQVNQSRALVSYYAPNVSSQVIFIIAKNQMVGLKGLLYTTADLMVTVSENIGPLSERAVIG